MKYQKIELNHYNLHLINTDKFKKTILSVCFKKKIKKNELTKRIFLSNILIESSKKYKTPHDIQIKCEDLYELNLDIYNLRSGKINILESSISFLDEKYTEANMFKESVDFLYDILYYPNVKNKKFDEKSFNRVKKYLNDDIKSTKDNPSLYSYNKMLTELDKNNIISTDINLRDLNKIDVSNLYEYYLDVINNEEVDIFLIGNITDDMIRTVISKFKLNNPMPTKMNHSSKYENIKLKEIKEKSNFKESTLRMAYTFDELTTFENRYVMPMLNYILGGSQDSVLFSEVREKESLCYSIYSSRNQLSELLDIYAGINKNDYKKVKKLILEQIEKIKNGKFENSVLINGKKYFENNCLTILDGLGSILNMYKSIYYIDSELVDERIKQIKKVTKKDIVSLANKMHLSVIFLLEGDSNE